MRPTSSAAHVSGVDETSTGPTPRGAICGACNLLCCQLDTHYFRYFGGAESPVLFIINGVVMSIIGGAIVGWSRTPVQPAEAEPDQPYALNINSREVV